MVLQWIHAGELARRHCKEQQLPKGIAPWSSLIGFRVSLAHSVEEEIDYARVREFSLDDLREYRSMIVELPPDQA